MAIEYKKFLAEKVLNEKEPVTYRSLCRALNVHSNLSKQMLYDFHQHENSKKAKSVNATYLIMGIQREPEKSNMNGHHAKDGEDDFMQSSPFASSMPQQDEPENKPKVTSVTLAREDDLDNVKSRFETIFSIHIYSLQPALLQDLNVLSDVGRETLEVQLKEDPLGQDNKHGMIQNKKVKRRTGIKVSGPPASTQPEKDAKVSSATEPKPSAKEDESSQSSKKGGNESLSSKSSAPRGSSQATSQTSKKTAREKSDLFKSFAKAKPKAKKTEAEPPATESTGASTAEDAVLDDASEEEREDLFSGTTAKDSDKLRKEKLERAENLKKMMDDDDGEEDEEMPDAPESPPEEEAPVEPVAEEPRKSEPREEVEVQGGRRRGRRQVMKKKVVKDEEGYLVTREEPAWEEFSEEEKPPPKKKPAVSVKPPPKSSKGGGKAGQGNIMSFFSKK